MGDESLVSMRFVTQAEIMAVTALAARIKSVNLAKVTIPREILDLVPEAFMRENVVVPYAMENGVLQVAIPDPTAYEMVEKLKFLLNREIEPVLASKEHITDAINKHYR